MPLQKVMVSLQDTLIERKTSDKGGFDIKGLESKVYSVVLQKAGYDTVSIEVAVTATERTEIAVSMKPETDAIMKVA